MAGSIPSQLNFGLFIPTTNIYDVQSIYSIDVNSKEFKELIVLLTQSVNNVAIAMNLKDSGYYVQEEFLNGQSFFPNPALSSTSPQSPTTRQVFRKIVNFGALPNTATKTVAHGLTITSAFSFTRIYAAASDQVGLTYLPIPYASNVAGAAIELSVDTTNVLITTGSNRTNYTVCYVVLEYIKQ